MGNIDLVEACNLVRWADSFDMVSIESGWIGDALY